MSLFTFPVSLATFFGIYWRDDKGFEALIVAFPLHGRLNIPLAHELHHIHREPVLNSLSASVF